MGSITHSGDGRPSRAAGSLVVIVPDRSSATAPSLPAADTGGAAAPDGRARELRRLLSVVSLAALVVGLAEAAAGVAFGEPRAAAIGLAAVVFAIWLNLTSAQLEDLEQAPVVKRIAFVALALIAVAAVARGRRGDRATRPGGVAGEPRLPVRPGLPVLATARRGGRRGDARR
jgi:hypothetical protein